MAQWVKGQVFSLLWLWLLQGCRFDPWPMPWACPPPPKEMVGKRGVGASLGTQRAHASRGHSRRGVGGVGEVF